MAVLLSITIAAVVVIQDWRKIHLRSTGWLLAPTLPGIPLGIALLTSVHQQAVKAVLAILIVAFSGYFLWVKKKRRNCAATAAAVWWVAAFWPGCWEALME